MSIFIIYFKKVKKILSWQKNAKFKSIIETNFKLNHKIDNLQVYEYYWNLPQNSEV